MKSLKYPLDIQYFAEGADEGTDPAENQEAEKKEEKTFTQKEVDDIVKERLARTKTTVDKTPEDKTEDPVVETVNPYLERYAQAEIKVAMARQGIDASKVDRAVRLIDFNTVLTEAGDVDAEKLTTSINELLEEWPELGPIKETEDKAIKFKVGADGSNKQGGNDDLIAAAFGNTK